MINNQFETAIDSLINLAKKINQTDPVDPALVTGYTAELNNLMGQGWDYALGKENELNERLMPAAYIAQRDEVIDDLQIRLSKLATKYRAAPENSNADKKAIADYHETYAELVRINGGVIGLDPDAELPNDLMPQIHKDFWANAVAALRKSP